MFRFIMGKQAFLEQLQRDAGDGSLEPLEQDKRRWLDDLKQLVSQIDTWLGDAQLAGKLYVEHQERTIAEEDLDPYLVPTLTIVFQTKHPRKVHVLPRAMQVVGGIFTDVDGTEKRLAGARGRVDLVCGAVRETLLRFPGADGATWRWLSQHEVLSEDGFFEVLRQMIA